MLPALNPTQTVSCSDGRRSASPDCRIQWHRYVASPPATSRTAVGMQRALESAIGLPSRSTSASRMLGFLTPADVRRSLTLASCT